MPAVRTLAAAWRDATTSTLDHLLALSVVVMLPAGLAGLAGGHLLDGNLELSSWLVVRLFIDGLLGPTWVLCGLLIAREQTFFHPTGAVGMMLEVLVRYQRAFWPYLLIALALHPAVFALVGLLIFAVAAAMTSPARWLEERGPLRSKGGSALFVGTLPLLLAMLPLQGALVGLDVWAVEEVTPGMFAIVQIARALVAVWAWSVVFRLSGVDEAG